MYQLVICGGWHAGNSMVRKLLVFGLTILGEIGRIRLKTFSRPLRIAPTNFCSLNIFPWYGKPENYLKRDDTARFAMVLCRRLDTPDRMVQNTQIGTIACFTRSVGNVVGISKMALHHPWLDFVRSFRKKHPKLKPTALLRAASKVYKKKPKKKVKQKKY